MPELDRKEQRAFIDEIMKANELEGAGKKRLVKFLCEKYEWNKQKVQFKLTRATLAERYMNRI
ncbi:MAG: hypothetical protein LRZ92_02355, partial [Methanosarcinaceae archaeon]|nr:hypothetical protein [Methanosarcinaceae archaeon]